MSEFVRDVLLVTIPAGLVLVATLGARFVEHYLQGKRETGRQKLEREREIRDARRKYRETIAIPIREALTELQTSLLGRSFLEDVLEGIPDEEKKGRDLSKIKSLEPLKEYMQRSETVDFIKTFTKVRPLISAITKRDTRKFLEMVFLLYGGLTKKEKEEEGITDIDIEENINLAYKKLEDFVTLAD